MHMPGLTELSKGKGERPRLEVVDVVQMKRTLSLG